MTEATPPAATGDADMMYQRKHARDARIEDSAARGARREQAREDLDRKLDQALECTFPASDPFQLSSPTHASRPTDVRTVREAVGIFEHAGDFQSAIDDLLSAGFHRAALSLLAGEQAVAEKLGHRYETVGALADDPAIPRSAYVSTEAIGDGEGGLIGGLIYVGAVAAAGAVVASGGTLAAAIATAALAGGTGGVIDSILAKWLGDHQAHYLQEQIDRGGLLLWVRTRDAEEERRAAEILRKHSGRDVRVHALPSVA